ncbi:MAG: CRTAC1 family protein, partial [Holophagales bacterium]|nr:CRTAC1 family protein [Holophagales bacterium]
SAGGGLRFEEASEEVGLADGARLFGLGVTWLDVDLDGWIDLYVANDTGPNYLYRNRGGRFEETAHFDGAAVTEDGKEQGSMGIAVADLAGEGWPSLFVTNFSEEYNTLYRNHRGEYFDDASFPSGTAASSLRQVGWGTAFLDLDNDGRLDLLVVNGHVYPQMDEIRLEASAPYLQPALLYRGLAKGTFEEVAPGGPLAEPRASRGLAVGDLDNDGRLDLVITDLDAETRVLRNLTRDAGHWLLVELRGRPPRRDALGARLSLQAGGSTQTRQVSSGTSYLSQHDLRQHFGLGRTATVESIEVHWPDGSSSTHGPFPADRIVILEQPEPVTEPSPNPDSKRRPGN